MLDAWSTFFLCHALLFLFSLCTDCSMASICALYCWPWTCCFVGLIAEKRINILNMEFASTMEGKLNIHDWIPLIPLAFPFSYIGKRSIRLRWKTKNWFFITWLSFAPTKCMKKTKAMKFSLPSTEFLPTKHGKGVTKLERKRRPNL